MYEFKNVKGCIEIYFDGKFLCTADYEAEANEEVEAHKKERGYK